MSADFSATILASAKRLGPVDVARVYGGSQPSPNWVSALGYRYMHAGVGKNAADLLLSIDVLETALLSEIRNFVLVTSDGDFTHLALRLRERGAYVQGLGEEKAPNSFRAACSDFSLLRRKSQNPTSKSKVSSQETPCELDDAIRKMIAVHSKNGEGMRIADLAPKMHSAHGTRISSYPEKTWRSYLTKRSTLYQVDPRGPEAKVRFLSEGFS